MGIFVAAHGWGGSKKVLLAKICHTYPTMMTWHSYTLPKEDPKIYESRDTRFEF